MFEKDDSWTTEADPFDMEKQNFSIAFQVRNYDDKETKHNTSYVSWKVHIYEGQGSNDEISQTVGVHGCTERDWD